ncbi:enterochelin esterase [Curtobacterium sp. 'Ferrero']|uniref:alpha/beta hydrolase n=1 Tax=Curtobacterium sp. 'Ferrero' TaxID=2033654 RepID=UPI000BDDB75D|nr:alpha/beta hydrolase-fold protein [Curtobacterium sp. 'Ferrero']PCN46561.1 enterochelin esterase [Curtobacterium sp. 'Ferrero']
MSSSLPYVPTPVVTGPVQYEHGPDSSRAPDAPRGRVEAFELTESAVFPGTTRTVRVFVPAQYDGTVPASVMVFQDGALYLDEAQDMRAGVVIEQLVHQGHMPVTVGVFVDPGAPGNRNAEYDPADDRYATFLVDEVLPAVRGRLGLRLSEDPEQWAVCGGSSGGNCAFTVAWQRPDRFRKVLAFVASFAQIPGGDPYPALIRSEAPRPLRVFLQANRFDLRHDEAERNWYSHNLQVAAALAERGYDHRIVLGDGGHSPNHGGVVLPDALRWLWR